MSAAEVEPDEIEQVEDLEPILPLAGKIEIDGIECRVRRMKTNEFLGLMNVLTAGLGGQIATIRLDFSDKENLATDLMAVMVLAVPRAPLEFKALLRQIVEPVDSDDAQHVAKYLMDNPDIDVMLDLFETLITQEKDDLSVLAGKAQSMWSRVSALYTKKAPKKTAAKKPSRGSGARSPARST